MWTCTWQSWCLFPFLPSLYLLPSLFISLCFHFLFSFPFPPFFPPHSPPIWVLPSCGTAPVNNVRAARPSCDPVSVRDTVPWRLDQPCSRGPWSSKTQEQDPALPIWSGQTGCLQSPWLCPKWQHTMAFRCPPRKATVLSARPLTSYTFCHGD